MVYSGAWGKLIQEKNRSWKSHDTVPLNTSASHFNVELTVTCNSGIFLAADEGWPGMANGHVFIPGTPVGPIPAIESIIFFFFFLFRLENHQQNWLVSFAIFFKWRDCRDRPAYGVQTRACKYLVRMRGRGTFLHILSSHFQMISLHHGWIIPVGTLIDVDCLSLRLQI